jgi:hypothetical protein
LNTLLLPAAALEERVKVAVAVQVDLELLVDLLSQQQQTIQSLLVQVELRKLRRKHEEMMDKIVYLLL